MLLFLSISEVVISDSRMKDLGVLFHFSEKKNQHEQAFSSLSILGITAFFDSEEKSRTTHQEPPHLIKLKKSVSIPSICTRYGIEHFTDTVEKHKPGKRRC